MTTTLNTVFVHVVPLLLPHVITPIDHTRQVLWVQTRPRLRLDFTPVLVLETSLSLVVGIEVLLLPLHTLRVVPMIVIETDYSAEPFFLELILHPEVVWHDV